MAQVLLVHKDTQVAKVLSNDLRKVGLLCDVATDMSDMRAVVARNYDVVILDWTEMDKTWTRTVDGYRGLGGCASIMAIVKPDNSRVKILALEAGADDCVDTPTDDVRELCARLRALLRRPRFAPIGMPNPFVTTAL
jgi:DNA-binding response OmpR family regulator